MSALFAINKINSSFASSEKLFILIKPESRYGKDWWTSKNTPNFPKNIKKEKAKNFFYLNDLNEEIKQFLKINDGITKLNFVKGEKMLIERIEQTWVKE